MSKEAYNVAVVGATGAVGEALLEILAEREFPVKDLHLLASERSVGETLLFNQKTHEIKPIEGFDFSLVDFAFFSAGAEISEKYAPLAGDENCVVIDNTSQFRYEDDIPLIIPEVNAEALVGYQARNIIANPNCSTIQMLLALKPIYDEVGIRCINVATYQAVSGAGRQSIEELARQTAELLNGQEPTVEAFPHQMAFNVIPKIDEFLENGYTREEMKLVWETQKILGDSAIQVNPTTVRVPVFYGHSEALHITTEHPIDPAHAYEVLKNAPGVSLVDDLRDYPTPVTHAASQDEVFVGRIRQGMDNPCGLNLWVVADNVRKGAALNAVQIAELLVHTAQKLH